MARRWGRTTAVAPAAVAVTGQRQRRVRRCGADAEAGQGLAEYSMILALVALGCIVGLSVLGEQVSALLSSLSGVF